MPPPPPPPPPPPNVAEEQASVMGAKKKVSLLRVSPLPFLGGKGGRGEGGMLRLRVRST